MVFVSRSRKDAAERHSLACLGSGGLLLVNGFEGTGGARVAELADARDLGSRGQPWGFDSPLSHSTARGGGA